MIVLDAYALLAYLRDEAAAGEVERLLRSEPCVINAVNLAETLDRLARVDQADMRDVESLMSGLIGGALVVVAVHEPMAWRTAAIRARHYHRRDRDLSLADCILIASAGPGDTIATADADVAGTARSEGVEVRRLPSGRR